MVKLALVLLVCALVKSIHMLKIPGPSVFVVTPSPKVLQNEGRSAPFYYNNWMRRMDTPNVTTSTTTTEPSIKTPDLIFAEFASDKGVDMQKSLRKLLQKEWINAKSSTTMKPVYFPDDTEQNLYNYEIPTEKEVKVNDDEQDSVVNIKENKNQHNDLYHVPQPVYLPVTTSKPSTPITISTTTTGSPINVENIWHIIDHEKYNSGQWEEISFNNNNKEDTESDTPQETGQEEDNDKQIDSNFALPGFTTKNADNESRAIRTETNFRFPYVNLKTFQLKNPKQPSNSKKGNNMYANLDSFQDMKNPVRGEAQDVMPYSAPIERYNPAQPYLPDYGPNTKASKQTSPVQAPMKAVANLIPPPLPPPPPPPPPQSNDALLPPSTYDSFPPYFSGPSDSQSGPRKPSTSFQTPLGDTDFDSPSDDNGNNGPVIDLGYRYKPPSAPKFVPTIPPTPIKPFRGYSYEPAMDNLPPKEYSYDKPPVDMDDNPPSRVPFKGYSHDRPPVADAPPPMVEKPVGGYSYEKPIASPDDHHAPSFSYGHHDHDYPELIFSKPHGVKEGMKGGDEMKDNDMGMMPPPPPDMKPEIDSGPIDDHGFPHDFPGDFKYHDFDEHEHYHHHHHHPTTTTTTTTTTETPRVNRYSYYYLGKKLYYLPLYFSVYFIIYVGALIIKAVLRHKIVYPNSFRPNDVTSSFFSKRSVDSWDLSNERLHEVTGRVTRAIATAADKYISTRKDA